MIPLQGCNEVMDDNMLPYGLNELVHKIQRGPDGTSLFCPVRGCGHLLTPPKRKGPRGTVCPVHGIRGHTSGTYSYADPTRNIIIAPEEIRSLYNSGAKFDSIARLGLESSEDCLSWNVWRSLQREGLLHRVVELITGETTAREPRMFLWGIEVGGEAIKPWSLLQKARQYLEADLLPVGRPQTEPDIALWEPGRYLINIEAKLASPNSFLVHDKTKLLDLTLGQFVQIYSKGASRLLDWDEARSRDRLPGQLIRNLRFADLQALMDSDDTEPYVVNLVREGYEHEICEPVLTLLHADHRGRFERLTWETIYGLARTHSLQPLCQYMENKTVRLKRAFKIP
jgi:hypothetical protein